MTSGDDSFSESLLSECGSCDRAVESVMGWHRILWDMAFSPDCDGIHRGTAAIIVPETALIERARNLPGCAPEKAERVAAGIAERLIALGAAQRRDDGSIAFGFHILQPVGLVRLLLPGAAPDHQLRYFAMRSIRTYYHCVLSSSVAHLFRLLADALNSVLAENRNGNRSAERHKISLEYERQIRGPLESVLSGRSYDPRASADLFLECCRAVRYIQPDYQVGCVTVQTRNIDSEYLLSRLFGLSTGIEGFDDLFGGGGLLLVDDLERSPDRRLSGRTVLTMGRYATGKSLLALQVALEVAAKGGIGWYMGFEQSAEECLYTLRTMCSSASDQVSIAIDPRTAESLLRNPSPDRGALIFLRTVKESFDHFLSSFTESVQKMQNYPLRLIVVDPINAIFRAEETHVGRSRVLKMFEDAKRLGTNVWLVAEEGGDADNRTLYEQNIADTVIHLTLKEKRGYVQRYMEVAKSRLQREQRGKHPYDIVAGSGIRVYPSSAAVDERVHSRAARPPKEGIPYGLSPLDDVLGKDAIATGDVVLIEGPSGSLKTRLGLQFLLRQSNVRRSGQRLRNLLVTTRDEDTHVKWATEEGFFRKSLDDFHRWGELRVCSLRSGYVQPGYVLQRIESELIRARLDGFAVDRLMIDNVAHWDMTCPFVREDDIFGDTLLELVRRYGVTSVLTCTRTAGKPRSNLLQSIIDSANCVIQLDRIQFRGTHKLMLRVLKTRAMTHRRESFDVTLTHDGLQVSPSSSLLRIQPGGTATVVGVRMFLHSETDMQTHYNQFVLNTVRSVLQSDAQLAAPDHVYMGRAFSLASASAVDELQLFQLDEFQVPGRRLPEGGNSRLYEFAAGDWDCGQWDEHYPRYVKHRPGKPFSVLPFYANPSMLAYRSDLLRSPKAVTDWRLLADECAKWEKAKPKAVFFDFPGGTQENYNCLFLEILLALTGQPPTEADCRLQQWLHDPLAIEAAKLFRRLCRRAYFCRDVDKDSHVATVQVKMNPRAVVWRTWYSTLNQLMLGLQRSVRPSIEVVPLPNRVAISGEWYLGVPAYSAAPDVGLKLIKFLTSREAELDRVKNGVGLPTRPSFYQASHSSVKTRVSPYFSMDLEDVGKLVETAFPRSSFQCYAQFSGVLCSHLQDIIELPETSDIDEGVSRLFESLAEKIAFMRQDRTCDRCTNRKGCE